MTDRTSFDDRLAEALTAYADEAPARGDVVSLAEWASAGPQRRGLAARLGSPRPVMVPRYLPARPAVRLAWLLLLLALIASILAGVAATGGWLRPRQLTMAPDPSRLPGATVPLFSTTAWTSMEMQRLVGGPGPLAWVVSWSGGYLSLTPTGSAGFGPNGPIGQGPLQARISHDGRSWTPLPDTAFAPDSWAFGAAPLGDGVIVITLTTDGTTTAWLSQDGTSWTSSPALPLRLTGGLYPWPPSEVEDSEVAGGAGGVVAIWGSGVAFSADGQAWHTVPLPGIGVHVAGVAAIGSAFVAVGSVANPAAGGGAGSAQINPAAWWSSDGLHWTLELNATDVPRQGFEFVQAGRDGLIANSWAGPFDAADRSLWTSPDGRSWSVAMDPLGGTTGSAGWFEGDGRRLLWYTAPSAATVPGYWTSLDGTHWTRLALSGGDTSATAGGAVPFLMRDGVVFVGPNGTWFGNARH